MRRQSVRLSQAAEAVGIYKRKLPEKLVSFSSGEGRDIFRRCMVEGGCEGYFGLAEQFNTQKEPAFCGLGSLSIVLNAFKGVEHIDEEDLEVHVPLEIVKKKGITFDEFACMAELNKSQCTAKRAQNFTFSNFRSDLEIATTTTPPTHHVITSFSRGYLGQTGDGHFSPVGAYFKEKGLVLVMDTARFKYPPYWVRDEELYEAMLVEDKETGKGRGWFVLRKKETRCISGIAGGADDWASVRHMVDSVIPTHLDTHPDDPLLGLIRGLESNPGFLASLFTPLTTLTFPPPPTPLPPLAPAWPTPTHAYLVLSAWPTPPEYASNIHRQLPPPTDPLFSNEIDCIRNRLLLMSGHSCSCII